MHRTPTLKRSAATAACLLGAAAMAGCGSSAKTSAAGSSPPATSPAVTSPAATGAPIRVGEIASLSGPLADTANGVKDGTAAWVDYTNAHGGISGHPVKITVLDDQASPTIGLQDAKTLVEQDHVVALVGEASGSVAAWQKYVETAGVPVVGGQSSETPFLVSPDFYGTGTNVLAIQYANLKLASQGGKSFGYVYCAEAPICAQATTLLKALGPSAGVTIPVSVSASSSAADYTAQCAALEQAGVSAYGLGLVSSTALRVGAACKTQGLSAVLVVSDGTITSQWLTSPSVDGTLVVGSDVAYTDSSTPATQTFQSAVKTYQPAVGSVFGPNVVEGWVSGALLGKAVSAAAGSAITPASIKAGLYTLKDETLGGMTPPLNYTPGKASPINCYFPEKLTGGTLQSTASAAGNCAPSALVASIAASF